MLAAAVVSRCILLACIGLALLGNALSTDYGYSYVPIAECNMAVSVGPVLRTCSFSGQVQDTISRLATTAALPIMPW